MRAFWARGLLPIVVGCKSSITAPYGDLCDRFGCPGLM